MTLQWNGVEKKFQPRDLIPGPLHVDVVVDIQDSRQIQTISIAEWPDKKEAHFLSKLPYDIRVKNFWPLDLILGPLHVDVFADIQNSRQIQTMAI